MIIERVENEADYLQTITELTRRRSIVNDQDFGKSADVQKILGCSYPTIKKYADCLQSEGELRGLIGPRESERIWERHILNSLGIAPFLPISGRVVDVGSGAGLPGIVLSAYRPDLEFCLVEPMERRSSWLVEIVAALGLSNVQVVRSRVEELGPGGFEAATARAVAPTVKLLRLVLPVLTQGGRLAALKGRSIYSELDKARTKLTKLPVQEIQVAIVEPVPGMDPVTVLSAQRS